MQRKQHEVEVDLVESHRPSDGVQTDLGRPIARYVGLCKDASTILGLRICIGGLSCRIQ